MLDTKGEKCLDYTYKNMIDELRATDWAEDVGGNYYILFNFFYFSESVYFLTK